MVLERRVVGVVVEDRYKRTAERGVCASLTSHNKKRNHAHEEVLAEAWLIFEKDKTRR
jgi:hypothetical protein